MSIVKEFKEFAVKGNMIDMAVGIIIGGAFGKIVSSIVGDVMMPILGLVLGGVDFSGLAITLREASEGRDALTLKYGALLQTSVDFLIIAFSMFMVIKMLNRLKKAEAAAPPPPPPAQEVLLGEIRDLLKSQNR